MLDKIIEIIMTILPFLGSNRKKRKAVVQEVKEFSERDAHGNLLVARATGASCRLAVHQQGMYATQQ